MLLVEPLDVDVTGCRAGVGIPERRRIDPALAGAALKSEWDGVDGGNLDFVVGTAEVLKDLNERKENIYRFVFKIL